MTQVTYFSLLQRVDKLRRSADAAAPSTECAVKLSLLLALAQADVDAHPVARSKALCATARRKADKTKRAIERARHQLTRSHDILEHRRRTRA